MARRNRDGLFIIAAGEVGSYTVCPESWRLANIEKVKAKALLTQSEGKRLHKSWAKTYDEAHLLSRNAKRTILLLFFTICLIALLMSVR